jgi:ABC-type sugar transport system permease subunit
MKKNKFRSKRVQDLIFCLLILLIPAIQFAIFYVGVNVNSFAMIFQKYEVDSLTGKGKYVLADSLFSNVETLFNTLRFEKVLKYAVGNSFISFVAISLVGITFSLVFSLYIFKKFPGSNIFKVLLFAPSILSAVVTVTMYRSFVDIVIPEVIDLGGENLGLLSNPDTKFGTIIFYNIWIGFGTQILMYSGAMNGIDPSITEAAKLDGANPWIEFFYIILPLIFPTIQTFLVTAVAGIFVNQINLVAFEAMNAPVKYNTIGYYLFKKAASPTRYEYPVWATMGAILTLIAAPLALLTRWALEKYGPSVD